MSVPSSLTDPERAALGTSSCIRLRILRKVDFPQPDGPMSAVTLRGSISRVTRSRTLLLPNHALTFVACNDAGPTTGASTPGWADPCDRASTACASWSSEHPHVDESAQKHADEGTPDGDRQGRPPTSVALAAAAIRKVHADQARHGKNERHGRKGRPSRSWTFPGRSDHRRSRRPSTGPGGVTSWPFVDAGAAAHLHRQIKKARPSPTRGRGSSPVTASPPEDDPGLVEAPGRGAGTRCRCRCVVVVVVPPVFVVVVVVDVVDVADAASALSCWATARSAVTMAAVAGAAPSAVMSACPAPPTANRINSGQRERFVGGQAIEGHEEVALRHQPVVVGGLVVGVGSEGDQVVGCRVSWSSARWHRPLPPWPPPRTARRSCEAAFWTAAVGRFHGTPSGSPVQSDATGVMSTERASSGVRGGCSGLLVQADSFPNSDLVASRQADLAEGPVLARRRIAGRCLGELLRSRQAPHRMLPPRPWCCRAAT